MGADIYFENGEYFRDSYNSSCLAWVIKESYWAASDMNTEGKNAFMKKLANITDKQIKKYVEKKIRRELAERETNESVDEYIAWFKEKRNFLKALDEKGELKIDEDGWSV